MTPKNERTAHQLLTDASDQARARRVLMSDDAEEKRHAAAYASWRRLRVSYRAGWRQGLTCGLIWGLLLGMLIICLLVQWPNPTFEVWQ